MPGTRGTRGRPTAARRGRRPCGSRIWAPARRTRRRPVTPSRSATTAGSRSTRPERTSPSGAKATGSTRVDSPAALGGRAGTNAGVRLAAELQAQPLHGAHDDAREPPAPAAAEQYAVERRRLLDLRGETDAARAWHQGLDLPADGTARRAADLGGACQQTRPFGRDDSGLRDA